MTELNEKKPGEAEPVPPAGAKEPERPADGGDGPGAAAKRKRTALRRRPTARGKPHRRIT
jgi:hypothetical protein